MLSSVGISVTQHTNTITAFSSHSVDYFGNLYACFQLKFFHIVSYCNFQLTEDAGVFNVKAEKRFWVGVSPE